MSSNSQVFYGEQIEEKIYDFSNTFDSVLVSIIEVLTKHCYPGTWTKQARADLKRLCGILRDEFEHEMQAFLGWHDGVKQSIDVYAIINTAYLPVSPKQYEVALDDFLGMLHYGPSTY
jgi:hypothetical protein